MLIFPAIDIYGGKAVRLYKGDYNNMTVYSENPSSVASDFKRQGASCLHMVDLEGAKLGEIKNLETVKSIIKSSNLFTQIGGGIRNEKTIYEYLNCGIDRVILGTAAVENREFLTEMVKKYGDKIAVGVDIKDGYVAVKGWVEKSDVSTDEMFDALTSIGVKTVICTDISKDGAMKGTNRGLYSELSLKYNIDIIASGGVSSLDDIKALSNMKLYGAIVGKAYYTGAIKISDAVRVAEKC